MIELAHLITSIATLLVAVGGVILGIAKLKEVHDQTNSRMTELVKAVENASFAAGREIGRDERDEVFDEH